MDPLVLGGLALTLLAFVLAMVIDGNTLSALLSPSAFVLVLFGTVGVSVIGFRLSELARLPRALLHAFRGSVPDPEQTVGHLVEFADVARREGVLALERRLVEVDDDFLQAGLQHVVDGLDAEQVRELLEIRLSAIDERHQSAISFLKTLGGYAPTMGMAGTVIGLVNMLNSVEDPAQLGIGMALALLTTLYGVLFANLLFLPLAERLTRLNSTELAGLDLTIDGVLAIQAGASPRLLTERLETYLPPDRRLGYPQRAEQRRSSQPATAAA